MKLKILLTVLFVAFVGFGIAAINTRENKIKLQDIKIESKTSDLNKLHLDYKQLNTQLETELQLRTTSEEKVKQLEAEREELKKREDELLKQVKAKQEEKRLAAEKAQKAATTAVSTVTATRKVSAASFGGNCESWIAAAGISDVANARELIRRESGCNPYAVNRSSGACGVAQELPCGKSGCALGNGACQVAWMDKYTKSRYGSWAAAVAFHDRNNWY